MLLAIDIGNSNISVGLFSKEKKLHFLASNTDLRRAVYGHRTARDRY